MKRFGVLVLALAAMIGQPRQASAGQPCPELPARNDSIPRILQLSTLVRDQLEQSNATAAFVARAGIDLREFGLVYSHIGLSWRDHPRGRWFTFHLLNPCGSGQSELVDHSLENFFKVELFTYDALVAIPSAAVQQKLIKAFFSPLAGDLHHKVYNMISYPFSTLYQNSNQWVAEVTASALAPANAIQNRQQAQTWLLQNGFEPSRVHIGWTRRMGARAFSAHVRFDDHTLEEEKFNLYQVVTVESIARLLEKHDAGLKQHRIRLP